MIESIYKAVLKSAFGLSMGVIWQHMAVELSGVSVDYKKRAETFFSLVEWLMSEGHLKLAHDGVFLQGSIQDQLAALKGTWPDNPGEDDLDGFGFWFLTEAPAGAVWIDSDGTEFWT